MKKTIKALALAGQLSPEARLGLALSGFAEVLDGKHRAKFNSLRSSSNVQPSGWEVIQFTEEINREGSRLHRSWQQAGTRIGVFLGRLQSLVAAGDVLIGGTQNLMISGVWFAVRTSLEVHRPTAVLRNDFAQLFPSSRELQTYLCEYLTVLVKLCQKAVLFTRKSLASQLAASLAAPYASEFGPPQEELDQWGRVIEQKANILASKRGIDAEKASILRSDRLALLVSTEAQRTRLREAKTRLLLALSPRQGDYDVTWRRHRGKGTCRWIFGRPEYSTWVQGTAASVLRLSGHLGSGKTVALANVVADISLQHCCSFFFCTPKEPNSLVARNIAGSIAYQLLSPLKDTEIKWDAAIDLHDPTSRPGAHSTLALLTKWLPQNQRYFVVLDGLEECVEAEMRETLAFLRQLMACRTVMVCLSSRSQSPVENMLATEIDISHRISLSDAKRDAEIEDYVTNELKRRQSARPLSPTLENLAKKQLLAGAQGMYLWVALQLETILPLNGGRVTTDEDILNILNNLPKSLPETFEAALKRTPDRRYEKSIMKLVVAAEEPLTLDELRVALSVVPGNLDWHSSTLPKDGSSLVSLCGGGLIELDEEDSRVRFIHHSAFRHITTPSTTADPATSNFYTTLEDAELYMGSVCVTYLNFPIFDSRLTVKKQAKVDPVVDKVVEATKSTAPHIVRLAHHWRRVQKSPATEIDIGRLLIDLQAYKLADNTELAKAFLPYAASHWIEHSRHFEEPTSDPAVFSHWSTLVQGKLYAYLPLIP
ncbi:hypothetical protein GQ53DRAFT_874485 [Thozetella sp. PMI_491]|nr:hypothetical protein GQ53DRAFT_874485 [Thozetella sp. PMI_491]